MYIYMYRNIAAKAASSPSSGGCKPLGGENPTIWQHKPLGRIL